MYYLMRIVSDVIDFTKKFKASRIPSLSKKLFLRFEELFRAIYS
jgi:hypothetical protein